MIIPTEEFWLPISIGYAMGEPIVTISRLKQQPSGFMSDVDLRNSGNQLKLPLHDIEENSRNAPNIDGLIFHLPRSGSTAVARAVACITDSTCFFEPAALDQLLSPQFKHITNRQSSLNKLLRLYGSASNKDSSKVFIKLSSWSTLNIHRYRLAMPNTPFFFTYRNPVEVLVQILERPTGWMQSPIKEKLENLLEFGTSSSLQEYCGKILKLFCERMLEAKPTPTLINHETLRESSLNAIKQQLHNQLSEDDLLNISDSFNLDSEHWHSSIKYSADSRRLRKQATTELIAICDHMITPYISQLESRHKN